MGRRKQNSLFGGGRVVEEDVRIPGPAVSGQRMEEETCC